MLVRYTGPYPHVDLPAVGVTVARGEVVDVPDDLVLGAGWEQTTTDPSAMTVAELRDALDAAGIDAPKSAKRAELLDLLTSSASEEDDQ